MTKGQATSLLVPMCKVNLALFTDTHPGENGYITLSATSSYIYHCSQTHTSTATGYIAYSKTCKVLLAFFTAIQTAIQTDI